jgi:hypothetical protein
MNNEGGGRLLLAFAFCLFIILCTLNSAGYRYGASDQAFYVPAVLLRLDATLFPRDAAILETQARLTGFDNVAAAIVGATRIPLPALLLILYMLTLVLLALGALRIASLFYSQRWTGLALLAALTLRHAITKSGTNTLEGYFHPRQLAFALGVLALAALLRGQLRVTAALMVSAAVLHPTAALWFSVWLILAAFIAERRLRRSLAVLVGVLTIVAAWAVAAGPLRGRLVTMDAAWLQTLETKDYLFPLRWPSSTWALNLLYVPLIVWAYRRRRAAGAIFPRESAVVAGCLSLVLVFFALLPLHWMRLALAIQLQPARIFWMLDFLATVYIVGAIAEPPTKRERDPLVDAGRNDAAGSRAAAGRALTAALVIAALSAARGTYLKAVLFPERPVFQARIPDDDWGRAMRWARGTNHSSGWLADPIHAAKYGTSVRVAGERDVLVEAIKDSALALYDRGVALEVQRRLEAAGDFGALTPGRARALASRFELDYLVTDRQMDLPLAFRSGSLFVYGLR